MEMKNDKEAFERWISTMPVAIHEVAKKYPPGWYCVKKGAPYAISCAGTLVQLIGYHDEGTVSVVVTPGNKTKEAITHERKMMLQAGKKTEAEMQQVHNSPVMVEIEPIWLEQLLDDYRGEPFVVK